MVNFFVLLAQKNIEKSFSTLKKECRYTPPKINSHSEPKSNRHPAPRCGVYRVLAQSQTKPPIQNCTKSETDTASLRYDDMLFIYC